MKRLPLLIASPSLLLVGVLCVATSAQGPVFPTNPFRLAQQPAAPAATQAPAPAPEETKADAEDEPQAAERKLLDAKLADVEERHKARLQEQQDWTAKLEKLATEGPAKSPPYSFLDLDQARDDLATQRQSSESLADAVARAREAVDHAADAQDAAGRELRRAKDALARNHDASATATLTKAVDEASRKSETAQQTLKLRKAELANLQLDQQVQALRQNYAEQLVALYEQDVGIYADDAERSVPRAGARSCAAEARNKQLTNDLNKFLQPQWYQAREKLDTARATETDGKLAALEAEVQAKDLAQQLADFEVSLNVAKAERTKALRTAWERRYELANSLNSASEVDAWLDETEAADEQLRADAAALRSRIDSTQKQLGASRRSCSRPTSRRRRCATGSAKRATRSNNSGG